MKFTVIIPARYGSTRFPGKPLALIQNKPMIQHVYERAVESGAEHIIVATDDKRIETVAKNFGAKVCLTRDDHQSGTERLAEVIDTHHIASDTIVVNVQGDEPFIPSENIRQVASNLHQNVHLPMATLAYPITEWEDLINPNVVKVVRNTHNIAMYFSRHSIPFDREYFSKHVLSKPDIAELGWQYLRHIGIYAYKAGFIKDYINMPETLLERTESLEQLRVLWYGHQLHVDIASSAPPHGVDTPEDLARLH